MGILVSVGEAAPLTLVLEDGDTAKFPQAKVFDEAGGVTPLFTVNMGHVAEGYYFGTFTVPSAAKFNAVYTVFTNAARTILDPGHGKSQDVFVGDGATVSENAEAQLNIAFDDTTGLFSAAAHIDRDGQTILSPTSATITVFDQTHTQIFTDTTTSSTNGVFIFTKASVVLTDNRVGYVKVAVTDSTGTATTIQSFTTVA